VSEVVEAPGTLAEEAQAVAPAASPAMLTVSAGAVAWAIVSMTYLLLRFAAVLMTPVGGAEAIHLSGAWQASIGVTDERFVPTLFQATTALLFEGTTSEQWPRLLAFAAVASVPPAIWLLRPHLGQAGALAALLFLAIDPVGLWSGAVASAMGFDVALAVWLFVFLVRGWPAPWAAGVAGLLVAVSGPITLPLVAGWAAVVLIRRSPLDLRAAVFATAGVLAGVIVASARFGLGFEDLAVPPLDLFAAGFEETWSTATAGELLVLYSWPIVLGGIAAAGYEVWRMQHSGLVDNSRRILVAWLAFALAWLLAGWTSHQAAPLAAVTLPAALLLGPAVARATQAMLNAEWRWARYLLPLAALSALLALAIVADWARRDSAGDTRDQIFAALWALIALAALAAVAYRAAARATLLPAALLAGALAVLPGTGGAAFHSDAEPLSSPISPTQARTLRNVALEAAAIHGGVIVVHADFADEITWPFRDSGKIVLASRVPLDAAVLIWPASAPPPDGFSVVQGEWNLHRSIEPPTDGWLRYLRWYIDRNSLDITPGRVAVYSKASP